jgi:signal transduction histidine kinase/CheY-like chemotaxis protein
MPPGRMPSTAVPVFPFAETLAFVVVEDSADDFELLVARLEAAFGSVLATRVDDRRTLEETLTRGGWAAVVCDHRLPRISSLEALAIARARDPDLPFVVVSGAVGEETAVELVQAGADDVVMKDRPERVAPALARAIEASRSRYRRREAEAALIESEARFRSLAANLPGMVFQIEADAGRLTPVFAGEGARRLFGIPPARLAAEPGAWLARLDPAQADRLRTRFLVATAGITTFEGDDAKSPAIFARHWIEEIVETASDADAGIEPRYIEFTARARRAGATRVLWDGIAIDITRQKEAEAGLTRSREELRELASHLAKVRENERAAIARELHDDVGSTLTAVKFQLQWLKGRLAGDAATLEKLAQLGALVDAAITASSRIMHDLRPAILDQGIVAALEWQARSFEQHTGVDCRFAASADEIALSPAQAIVVFRVCQEALNNVAKHAGARHVEVMLTASDDGVALEVRDDGTGIDPGAPDRRGRFGLTGMHERALAIGAEVSVGGRDDGPGTSVRLVLPVDAVAATGTAERSEA